MQTLFSKINTIVDNLQGDKKNTLKLDQIPPDNTYAIGDIHGCKKSLIKLLASLPLNKESVLIFLGDYIDRGPDSRGVIDYLIDFSHHYQCYFLIGNHEVMMLDALKLNRFAGWVANGGVATMTSYGFDDQDKFAIPDLHREFLDNTYYYIDTPDYLFVHAGIKPFMRVKRALTSMNVKDMVWERSHMKADHLDWEKTVVCGHTPIPEPLLKENLIAIDTGCVYAKYEDYGKLTAIRLPDRKLFFQDNID